MASTTKQTTVLAVADGAVPPDLTERLCKLRDALLTGLVERDVAIRLALIAVLAEEHLLMVGPPGTAKSLIARRLHLAFAEASYFERLLTRFSVPEELFGPLSIKGLEEDRYERLTEKYLPTASIAFLDEIFKANSAILNALLTLLNEREFDNGTRREPTPLLAVVGASNELPDEEELGALFDRFLLRVHVGPVSEKAFPDLLRLRGQAEPDIPEELKLTAADLASIRQAAVLVEIPSDVEGLLCDLRDWCDAQGIPVSDRRWRKVVKLLQVSALTNGRPTASVWDCWLLQHCLWSDPEDREKVYTWYALRVGASEAMDPSRLTKLVTGYEARLARDQNRRAQAMNESHELLYLDRGGEPVTDPNGLVRQHRGQEPLFVAQSDWGRGYNRPDPTNRGAGYTLAELDELQVDYSTYFAHWHRRNEYLQQPSSWYCKPGKLPPMTEPMRYSRSYIASSLAEISGMSREVTAYREKLAAHVSSLDQSIRQHLWVTSDFIEPARSSLEQTQRVVASLQKRLDKLRKGYEALPLEREITTVVRRDVLWNDDDADEGTLTWLVDVGDTVGEGQALARIEADGTDAEALVSPVSGKVAELCVEDDTSFPSGTRVLVLEVAGDV